MLSFICDPCKSAGKQTNPILKEACHRGCHGDTRCDCQHRVGRKNV